MSTRLKANLFSGSLQGTSRVFFFLVHFSFPLSVPPSVPDSTKFWQNKEALFFSKVTHRLILPLQSSTGVLDTRC